MHAVMVHGNAVAHADGGNFERNATGHINAGLHGFANFIEVIVTRNNVVAGIEHRDEGLLHFFIGKAVGLQQAAVGSTRHANFNGIATKLHRFFLLPSSVIANPRNAVDRRDFALDALSRKAPALHTGVPRWPAAFSFAARGSFRSRPPQVLSPPACCGMGSFLLALSSHLLSDVDYTERNPKRKGLSHFNAIK